MVGSMVVVVVMMGSSLGLVSMVGLVVVVVVQPILGLVGLYVPYASS